MNYCIVPYSNELYPSFQITFGLKQMMHMTPLSQYQLSDSSSSGEEEKEEEVVEEEEGKKEDICLSMLICTLLPIFVMPMHQYIISDLVFFFFTYITTAGDGCVVMVHAVLSLLYVYFVDLCHPYIPFDFYLFYGVCILTWLHGSVSAGIQTKHICARPLPTSHTHTPGAELKLEKGGGGARRNKFKKELILVFTSIKMIS